MYIPMAHDQMLHSTVMMKEFIHSHIVCDWLIDKNLPWLFVKGSLLTWYSSNKLSWNVQGLTRMYKKAVTFSTARSYTYI